MAIVASFIGVPTFGIPDSFQVQFTDQSTGSPTHWWWEFGDGETSEDQHPLHTYNGAFGDQFTVTLKAFIGGTETSHGILQQFEHNIKTSSEFQSIQLAFDSLVSKSFTLQVVAGDLKAWYFSDGTGTDEESPTYNAQIRQPKGTISLPAPGGAGPSNFKLVFTSSQVSIQEGTINSSLGGSYIAGGPSGQFIDVTDQHGNTIEFIPVEVLIAAVPPQAPFEQAGVGLTATLIEIQTAAADDTDELTKINYILFGTPPIAAFSASPIGGPNPLEVQLENLSTPAVGLPTSYSWKKRKHGSGDSFVEFSTATNPIEDFTK